MEIILANHLSNWKDFTRQFTGNLQPGLKDVLYYHFFFPTENCTWQVAVETSQNVWGNWASHSDNNRPHFERSKNWDSDGKTWTYVNLQKSSIWQRHICVQIYWATFVRSKLNAFLPLFCTQLHNITILWKVLLCVNFKYFAAF